MARGIARPLRRSDGRRGHRKHHPLPAQDVGRAALRVVLQPERRSRAVHRRRLLVPGLTRFRPGLGIRHDGQRRRPDQRLLRPGRGLVRGITRPRNTDRGRGGPLLLLPGAEGRLQAPVPLRCVGVAQASQYIPTPQEAGLQLREERCRLPHDDAPAGWRPAIAGVALGRIAAALHPPPHCGCPGANRRPCFACGRRDRRARGRRLLVRRVGTASPHPGPRSRLPHHAAGTACPTDGRLCGNSG